MSERIKVGQELMNVPFSDMVCSLATAIAEAQAQLDQNSVEILRLMGDKERAPVALPYVMAENGEIRKAELTTSMIGAGFQPTFYQFAETIIEVRMAVTANYDEEYQRETDGTIRRTTYGRYGRYRRRPITITTTPIDASYCSKYNYSQEGTSLLRTRLVPVPPNSLMQQQLDLYARHLQFEVEQALEKQEASLEQQEQNRK